MRTPGFRLSKIFFIGIAPVLACAILASVLAFSQSGPASRIAIVEDQQQAAFRFMIDGREIARLDGAGLYVAGDIRYAGALVDTGGADRATTDAEPVP